MCFVVFAIVAFDWVLVLGCLRMFDCWFCWVMRFV